MNYCFRFVLLIDVVCLRMFDLSYFYFICLHMLRMSLSPKSIAGVPWSRALPCFPFTAHHLCAFLM